MIDKREAGKAGEDTAVDYLAKKGYHILRRNYRFDRGEIDIVAEDQEDLVFVEVKARRSRAFGAPEDAISPAKSRRIKKVAEGYLFEHDIVDRPCRFDIVAIEYQGEIPIIRHYIDAH